MSTMVVTELELENERLRAEVSVLQQLLHVHEQAALSQNKKLQNILDSISDAFLVISHSWRVLRANRLAEDVFSALRKRPGEMIGKDIWTELPDLRGSEVETQYRKAMEQRIPTAFEIYYPPLDEWFEVHVYPSEDGISVFFQNVTSRKKSDQEREELLKKEKEIRLQLEQRNQEIVDLNASLERRVIERTSELQALVKELETFSYSVSHDLRTPLRTIAGFSNALMEDYLNELVPEAQDFLHRIEKATGEMGNLIDALLQLSRLSRAELELTEANLSTLAESLVDDLRRTDPERKVAVTIQPDIVAKGDERLLLIVLQNLIGNAWKFTSKLTDAKIEFGISPDKAGTAYIRDNGIGFDMKYYSKLFGPFQRLHASNEFEGSGIGLATVQRILLRHGGRAWAESKPSGGTTFFFTLPDLRQKRAMV